MRNSIRTMFVVLAVLMSFTIVQAQEQAQEGQVTCSVVVEGRVIKITQTGAITVNGFIDDNINNNNNNIPLDDVVEPEDYIDIIVYGVPLDMDNAVAVDDWVKINVNTTPDDKFIACYLTVTKIVNEEPVEYDIVLRRRY